MIRLSTLTRAFVIFLSSLFLIHFLSTSFGTSSTGFPEDDPNWSERLGLDHYADFEAGVTGRLGTGIDKMRDGLGAIKGGLGWGVQGTKLGSLYELISTSNPSPRPAYYDERTSLDRIRLSSTRVLGHGVVDPAGLAGGGGGGAAAGDDDSVADQRIQTRRHILVTGGFGSLGKHVVRDLLLGISGGKVGTTSGTTSGKGKADASDWLRPGETVIADEQEDILVTVLDVHDRSSELNYLLQSATVDTSSKVQGTDPRAQAFTSRERTVSSFTRAGRLRLVQGDVRDKDLLAKLLAPGSVTLSADGSIVPDAGVGKKSTGKLKGHVANTILIPPVSGVIHLAAYSPSACRLNPVDCLSVETHGMEAILGGLKRDGPESKKTKEGQRPVAADRPWIVVPRRGEAWHEVPEPYNGNASSISTPPAQELLKGFATQHPIHSLLLQLPSSDAVIGDPFAPRFDTIPHIIQSALGDLPIQVYTFADAKYDTFLSINDASQSIIQGARMLELSSKKSFLHALAFVAELAVVGPELKGKVGPTAELAEAAMGLIDSKSPFAEIVEIGELELVASERTAELGAVRKLSSKVLGITPATSLRDSLKTYMDAVLQLQAEFVTKKINVACSTPPAIPVLEEGLLGLNGCNLQLLTVLEGEYQTLGCSAGLAGPHTTPLAVVNAVPFKEGVRGVEVVAERGLEGKVDLQLRCPTVKDGKLTGESEIVIWAETMDGGEFAEASKPKAHAIAEWFTVDFVHREQRAFTLTLPPTEGTREGEEPKRRLALRDPTSAIYDLVFTPPSQESRPLLWKINPICCPSEKAKKELWDFFKEDPVITSQVTYPSSDGRTSLVESTLAVQKCKDLRAEHERVIKLRKILARKKLPKPCEHVRGEPFEWHLKDLPVCEISCEAPLVCLSSELCKCTRDRCGDKRANSPFPAVAFSSLSSFPSQPAPKELSLSDRVAAIPWDAVILPGARRAFASTLEELPQAHVVDLPTTIDNHLTVAACYDLDKSPLPFLGDHFLVEAFRNKTVPLEDADFVVVPYYQGCYYNYLQENTFKKLADTTGWAETRIAGADHISASKIAVPFTHDFGSCTGWWPRLEDVLGRLPPSPMDKAVALQVNGDYNTHCVKPDRDVVVPAVSKHSKSLVEAFGSLEKVSPSADRKHLAFFAGGVRGFGAFARTRIGCGRTNQDTSTASILYQQFATGKKYLGTLNSAKFCLLPRGIPAWTTRTFEAIYAGCIPAFIVDRNIFPFQDILDYSLFSVTIPENQANKVEEILAKYSDAQVTAMQAHVLRVREAFLFKEGEEWERKGPLFFSLVSMAMRLSLAYPEVDSCPPL